MCVGVCWLPASLRHGPAERASEGKKGIPYQNGFLLGYTFLRGGEWRRAASAEPHFFSLVCVWAIVYTSAAQAWNGISLPERKLGLVCCAF